LIYDCTGFNKGTGINQGKTFLCFLHYLRSAVIV